MRSHILCEVFKDFGVVLAESKTKTMSWGTSEEIRKMTFLIEANGQKLENVREFRYLGHLMSDDPKNTKYLTHQITSAYNKYHEWKHVFHDYRINLSCRVKMAEAVVRNRLVYGLQTERLNKNQ